MNTPSLKCRVFVNDALMMTIPSGLVPKVELPEGVTAVDTDPRRISLVSRRGMRRLRDSFNEEALGALTPPMPVFGEPRLVIRDKGDGSPRMACVVSEVKNHDEIAQFVNSLFESIGQTNPEKKFVYHLTIANNSGGHPRGSIAYLNKSDFQGEPMTVEGPVEFRPVQEGAVQAEFRYRRGPR